MSRVLQVRALAQGNASASATYGANYANYTNAALLVRSNFQRSATGPAPQGFVSYDGTGNITNIGNGVQADYVYALNFNMIPTSQRSNCVDRLLNSATYGIRKYNSGYTDPTTQLPDTNHLSTGIQATGRAMLELSRNGYTQTAYQLLTDYRFPSWLYQVTAGGANYMGPQGAYGATTCWEQWDGLVPRSGGGYHNPSLNSLNHFWAGSVGEWIYRTVGGINPDDSNPAFANAIVKPEPGGGITNAFTSFNSMHGPVVCSWSNTIASHAYTLNVTIPANATAAIYVPTTNNLTGITESGRAAATAPGVFSYYFTNWPNWTYGATVFRVGSGAYSFSVTNVILQ
jgi:alpha-L-rhamnosidase